VTNCKSLALLLGLGAILAACGSSGSAAASTNAPPVPSVAPRSSTPSTVPSNDATVSQTNTDWGRIWDTLPPGFPTIHGATPDEDAGGGAASGVLVVDGVDAKTVATSLQTSLQTAGYTTVGSLEPLEDGSVVLDMTGQPAGCMLQVTTTPTGGVTTIRILYGAACPNG